MSADWIARGLAVTALLIQVGAVRLAMGTDRMIRERQHRA